MATKTTISKNRTRKVISEAPKIDPLTGMTEGSQSLVVAQELMKGGESKHEVANRLREMLPAKSAQGNENPIDQKVYSVIKRLEAKGFTVETSFKLVPPVKGARAASRSIKKAAPARKTAAKKAPAKRSTTARKTVKKAPVKKATTARKTVRKRTSR